MMNKIISAIIVFLFIFSLTSPASAAIPRIDTDEPEIITFTNGDGDTFRIELIKHPGFVVSRVFINDVFAQESIASEISDTVSTVIYNSDGDISSSETISLSSIESTPQDHSITAIVPRPDDGGYPDRSIFNEPVDNTGLMYTFTQNGKQYYYIGAGTDSFAPDVLGRIHRAYTSTYEGETHYWTWTIGMTISAIAAVIALVNGPTNAILSILDVAIGGYISYLTSIELATYTHDYSYQVAVGGVTYFTTTRNKTYWRIDNVTTGQVKWEQKSFNYGFSPGNQEMLRMGIEAYCAAN